VRLRRHLAKFNWIMAEQMGIDLRRMFFFVIRLPRFIYEYVSFRSLSKDRVKLRPCLHDEHGEGGEARSEYFLQDLMVARCVFEEKPTRHIDIGSRVDGFVAHVASFRTIEVFDVRPNSANVPGIRFRQIDMMSSEGASERCDSLSCLHALEHFGLGRYGDPISPKGFEDGFAAMATMVQPGGRFYLSVPIGRPRVEFNAHRIVSPRCVMDLAGKHNLRLVELTVLREGSQELLRELGPEEISALEGLDYALGVFILLKPVSA
jgi:hypothetical protein